MTCPVDSSSACTTATRCIANAVCVGLVDVGAGHQRFHHHVQALEFSEDEFSVILCMCLVDGST